MKILLLFFAVAILMPLLWLPSGKIWGGADVGIPMYAPENQLEIVSSSWWETHGTGITIPVTYTAEPFYRGLVFLESLGLSPAFNQKLFIFLILFGGSASIYFLCLHFKLNKNISVIAALFVLFNFFTLSVWHRGVHNGMLMLLLMPLTFLILVKGISKKSYLSILLLNLVSFLLSYAYGALGFVFTSWLLWSSYVLFEFTRNKTSRKFLLGYFFLLAGTWVFSNIWWLYNFWESSKYAFGSLSQSQVQQSTVDVLVGLKNQTQASFILRGMSRFYHYDTNDWGEFYKYPMMVFLSWVPALIVFSTVLFRKNYKFPLWRYSIILFTVIFFIAKGANPPFGKLNIFAYNTIPFLAPLRNPYEKVGILLIIPYAILFSIGIHNLYAYVKEKRGFIASPLAALAIFISLFFLVWPFWLGKTFIVPEYNYLVEVPNYYQEASAWLKQRNDDSRILHLPLAPGESVDYNWNYTGGEPSQIFFSGSSFAYSLGLPSVDLRLNDLISQLHDKNTDAVRKAIESLNIGWIVVHNEVEWKRRGLESVNYVNEWLNSKPDFLEFQADFGPLSIWKVKDEYRSNHFYLAQPPFINISSPEVSKLSPVWEKANKDYLFTIDSPNNTSVNDKLKEMTSLNFIYPQRVVGYRKLQVLKGLKEAKETLPYVKYLPGSNIYPLIKSKESLESYLVSANEVINCIDRSSKRLVESQILFENGAYPEVSRSLEEYAKYIESCKETAINSEKGYYSQTTKDERQIIESILFNNLSILSSSFNEDSVEPSKENALSVLRDLMHSVDILPLYPPAPTSEEESGTAYEYSVETDGSYTLAIDYPVESVFSSPPRIIRIDEEEKSVTPRKEGNTLLYGPIDLLKGIHEIHIAFKPRNLIQFDKLRFVDGSFINQSTEDGMTFDMRSIGNSSGGLTFPLETISDLISYDINFDYFVIKGSPPSLKVVQDNDYVYPDGKVKLAFGVKVPESRYERYWIPAGYTYEPSKNSRYADFYLLVDPWNDCDQFFLLKTCLNKVIFDKYNHESILKVKNLSITANYVGRPYLLSSREVNTQTWGSAKITSNKVTGEYYEINISEQKPPYALIFSETFHPLWKLYAPDGSEIKAKQFQANAYANGWLIEEPLPERVIVRFALQDLKKRAIIISIVGSMVALVIILYVSTKKKREK